MTRLLTMAAVGALVLALGGCADDYRAPKPDPYPTAQPAPDLVKLKRAAGIRDCQPGTATDSRLPDLVLGCLGGGTNVDLASLQGPMIVNIWFSGCGPCRDEMPRLQAFEQTYGTTVPVIGIDFQDQFPDRAIELADKTGATYPQLADPAGEVGARSPFPRFSGFPYVLFVDEHGDIPGFKIGGVGSVDELVTLTQKYLGVDL